MTDETVSLDFLDGVRCVTGCSRLRRQALSSRAHLVVLALFAALVEFDTEHLSIRIETLKVTRSRGQGQGGALTASGLAPHHNVRRSLVLPRGLLVLQCSLMRPLAACDVTRRLGL